MELSPVVQAIFPQSLHTDKLPEDWGNATTSPVFKKGNRHLAENYRLVSLTSVCCKLMEHIICKHILQYIESHSLLTPLQHGFHRGFSYETQLLVTPQDILTTYDNRDQVNIIVLDDTRHLTLSHMNTSSLNLNTGIHGPILDWICEFLTNRHQTVVVNGKSPTPVHVDSVRVSVVPQGTVLGPLLFLIFINDLPLHIKYQVCLFADDSLLYRCIESTDDQKQLQEDLASLEE